MAGYRLRQSGEEVQGILDNAAMRAQLTAETERAQSAEQQLQTNIDNEAQARHQADTTLDGKIAAEKTRAEGAEGSLQTAINNEAQARQQADGVLDGKIAAEKTRADGAEQALQTAIDNEAKARRQTDGALDVSELNATENPHTLAKYVNLSAAIAAIPTDYQKGGMSIKFVQSSDNNYVQYFCISQTFTIDVNYWEKTNLEEEINTINHGDISYTDRNYEVGKTIDKYGNVSSNPNYNLTEYISVPSNTLITVKRGGASTGYIALYDSNKSFLDYYSLITERDFNTGNSYAFIRFDFPNDYTASVENKDAGKIKIWEAEIISKSLNLYEVADDLEDAQNDIVTLQGDTQTLEAKTDNLESKVQNYKEGVKLNTSGEEVSDATTFLTCFVAVTSGQSVTFSNGGLNNNGILGIYNSSKEFINYYTGGNNESRTVTIPENGSYIKMSGLLSGINNTLISSDGITIWSPNIYINTLQQEVQRNTSSILTLDSKIEDVDAKIQTYESGIKLNTSGSEVSDSTAFLTYFVEVTSGQTVTFYNGGLSNGVIGLYNSNKEYINYYTTSNNRTITVPENISYIRMSGLLSNIENTKIKTNGIDVWIPVETDVLQKKLQDNELNRKERLLETEVNLSTAKWLNRYTIVTSGALVGTNYAITTNDLIPISDVNFIKFVISSSSTFTYEFKVALYDKNGTFVSLISPITDLATIKKYVSYMKICVAAMEGETKILGNPDDLKVEDISIVKIRDTQKYEYDGDVIKIRPQLSWNILCSCEHTGVAQASCCYKDTLFVFHAQNMSGVSYTPCVEVFDLKTHTKIQEILYGNLFGEDTPHHNSVNFSTNKYDETDDFPMIYTCDFNNSHVFVLRVLNNNGIYSLELLQTISVPVRADGTAYQQYTCFLDNSGYLYVGGANVGDDSVVTIDKYPLPTPPSSASSYSSEVTILIGSRIKSFTITRTNPYGYSYAGAEQGGVIYGNLLYWAMGHPSTVSPEKGSWLNVIDLDKEEIVSTIPFTAIGLDYEPEGVFIHNNKLGVNFNGSSPIVEFTT